MWVAELETCALPRALPRALPSWKTKNTPAPFQSIPNLNLRSSIFHLQHPSSLHSIFHLQHPSSLYSIFNSTSIFVIFHHCCFLNTPDPQLAESLGSADLRQTLNYALRASFRVFSNTLCVIIIIIYYVFYSIIL